MTGAQNLSITNMNTKDQFQTLTQVINELLNRRIDAYMTFQNSDHLVRHLPAVDGWIKLQPTYSACFYGVEEFIKAAISAGFYYFISVENNKVDVPAPVLNIYKSEVNEEEEICG